MTEIQQPPTDTEVEQAMWELDQDPDEYDEAGQPIHQ